MGLLYQSCLSTGLPLEEDGGMAANCFVTKREGDVCCLSSSGMGDRADRIIELRSEGKNHVFRNVTVLGHLAQKLANIQ